MKEDYHAKNHTKFIKIDYMPNENILETLKSELIKMGFKLKPKSYEEIFEQILDNNYRRCSKIKVTIFKLMGRLEYSIFLTNHLYEC